MSFWLAPRAGRFRFELYRFNPHTVKSPVRDAKFLDGILEALLFGDVRAASFQVRHKPLFAFSFRSRV